MNGMPQTVFRIPIKGLVSNEYKNPNYSLDVAATCNY